MINLLNKRRIGIKGFNKDLICIDFQYKIGETYESQERPVLCKEGSFHYSERISDVTRWYTNNGTNRFCIVEILGDVDKGYQKSCTNKIKILEEVNLEEFRKMNALDLEFLVALNRAGFLIGGSTALKLKGFKLAERFMNPDIDLIVTGETYKKIQKSKYFKHFQQRTYGKSCDATVSYYDLLDRKYDIMVVNEFMPSKVRVLSRGTEYVIYTSQTNDIWEAKLKYALSGSIKHMDDIRLNKIKFYCSNSSAQKQASYTDLFDPESFRIDPEDNLPF